MQKRRRRRKKYNKYQIVVSLVVLTVVSLYTALTDGLPHDSNGETPIVLPDGSYLRVDYVDVGQADFVIIECDGKYMTIDGGNVADRATVTAALESRGIHEVEYVIATHAHEDHCGAIPAIFSYADVENVYCPVTEYRSSAFNQFLTSVEDEGLAVTVPVLGEQFTLGSAAVEVIGPAKDYDDTNNTSIVLRLTYGEKSFLFTGDAETSAEKDILALGFDVSADVLKVGHHGSSTSTSYQWLKAVAPQYGIISSSREDAPEYNHPHEEVVSRLRDADVTVYRTDLQGTVTCITDGTTLSFTVERNPDADTLYDAGEGGNHKS